MQARRAGVRSRTEGELENGVRCACTGVLDHPSVRVEATSAYLACHHLGSRPHDTRYDDLLDY